MKCAWQRLLVETKVSKTYNFIYQRHNANQYLHVQNLMLSVMIAGLQVLIRICFAYREFVATITLTVVRRSTF